eukprot:GFUD01024794.1.p1 GENE.GFUD01024794.1~~GFUD01024794.1.p1  ORF type:complete len:313 (+),score=136.84 GFUD01024794.1:138-1076(+)
MGVRIFVSCHSGNKEIENSQQRILMVLTSRAIQFVTIDISAPGMQEMRSFMRERGRKREGQRNVLPPQIFNGEECRGDYEGFDIANEDDDLEEFLGIPRKNPKAEPVKTGAVASDVGKLNPGKLMQEEMKIEDAAMMESENITTENDEIEIDTDYLEEIPEPTLSEDSGDYTNEILEKNEIMFENPDRETLKVEDIQEDASETLKEEDIQDDAFKDRKLSNEEEAFKNEVDKVSTKSDGLMGHIKEEFVMDNDRNFHTIKDDVDVEDSSDESSDEDTTVEYMPDGELVRKKSRGFKQLNNCKRFWKASQMVG